MRTSAKLGLVGTALYAATLAAPVYAAVKQEVKPVEPVNLEQITTIEQADNLYKEKITEYASDGLFKFDEFKNIYKIQNKRYDLIKKEKEILDEKYSISADIAKLDEKIDEYNNKLTDDGQVPVFDVVREKLESNILAYYKGLIQDKDSKWNVTYSAETILEPELNIIFKEIVSETDKILKNCYKDDMLDMVLNKEEYKLRDILTIYAITERNDRFDKNREDYLRQKLTELEEKKKVILGSEKNIALKEKINRLDETLTHISYGVGYIDVYFSYKKDIDQFEKKYGNFNKMFARSHVSNYLLEKKGLRPTGGDRFNSLEHAEKEFRDQQKLVITYLDKYLKSENLEVKIEELGNPAKKRMPWWFGSFILGIGFPIVRNMLIKKYVRGKEMKDGFEYFLSSLAGLGNGLTGFFFLDGLHPLVYPTRMLLTPLVFQPAFKLFKFDPCKNITEC